ncbi:AsmA-like C-terminal region-containing protein [Engelhardtia mirabilis]|uniref:Uncharacterized protein n=1 Tax=Engelhardtia mirabilis TaxID=2528011 RepID=A0A518BNH4_9BACT|nr:hypothetical protein Pla133_36230 [Planctomycetes bacterium Pla133]QDV02850.1 hypothetical protein Pla86_36210 [Planctomycetes bacterium Pla86]
MRRILRLLEIAVFVGCVVLVVGTLALFPLERSGALRDALQAELDAVLGEGAHIGSVRFHWSDPGLRLRDLTIASIPDENGGETIELIRLDEVRVQLGLFPPRVRRVAVLGGVVAAGPALGQRALALDASIGRNEADEDPGAERAAWFAEDLPQILVRDLEVLVALDPSAPARPLGRVELRVEPTAGGTPSVEGSITPRLGPPDSPGAPVRFVGGVDDRGELVISTAATAVPIATAALPDQLRAGAEALGAWIAAVDLEGSAHFEPGALIPARTELRARASGLRGEAVDSGHLPEGAQVDLQARLLAPSDGELLWARDLGCLSELRCEWRGAQILVRGALGADAPPGIAAMLQLDADQLPIGRGAQTQALSYLESAPYVAEEIERVFAALDPRGTLDLRAAMILDRRNDPDLPVEPRVVLVADPAGDAQLAYRGFEDQMGARHGFPIRASEIHGRAIHLHDPLRSPNDVTALIGLRANHPSGTVTADLGIVGSTPDTGPWPRVLLDLRVPRIDVPTDMVRGVEGLGLEFDLTEVFAPRAGTAIGRLQLDQPHERVPPVMAIDLEVQGAAATWDVFPAPLDQVDGSLHLRWSGETVVAQGTEEDERPLSRRAFGLGFAFEARAADGSSIDIAGALRDPELAQLESPLRYPPGQFAMLRTAAVSLRGVMAGGPVVDVARQKFPELAELLDQVVAEGAATVHLSHGIVDRSGPARTSIEVLPDGLRAAPQGLLIDELEGWVRVVAENPPPAAVAVASGDSIEGETAAADAAPRPMVYAGLDAQLIAVGPAAEALASAVPIALDLRPAAAGLHAAGLELDDRTLLDQLARSGGAAVAEALLAARARGPVDVNAAVRLGVEGETFGDPRAALHLRDDRFTIGGLEAKTLRGTLRTDGSRVDAPWIRGEVGGVAIELRDGLAGTAADLVRSDPGAAELLRYADPEGLAEYAFGGNLSFDDAELSPRILADYGWGEPVTDPVLRAPWERSIAPPAWQLRLDAERARFVAALPRDREPSVAVAGRFVPHDVRVGVGLPLTISSAELVVPHAVIEGGRMRALAELSEAYGRLGSWSLAGLSSTVSYVEGRLTLDGLQGGFAGGLVGSPDALAPEALPGGRAFSIELGEPHRFDLALGFTELDVRQLLESALAGGGADRGKLRGYLRLTGDPGDPMGLEGNGFVALEDARLWSIPVVREVFSQLGFENTGTFDWMRTRLALRDGELRMTDAVAHSPLLKLVGEGTLGLDGRLEHEFDINYSLFDGLGVIARVFYWFQSRVVRLKVRGEMTRPRVIVTNPIIDLFGLSARQPPRLPFPSMADVPERF